MNTETFPIFLAVYTPAAMFAGWCLCAAAKRGDQMIKKCDDAAFEKDNNATS